MHPISDRVFLEGALRAPRSDARITVLNPSTGEPLGRVPDGGAADVGDAVAAAGRGGGLPGRPTPARERGAVLSRLARAPPRERGGVRAPRQPGQRADACGNPGPGDAERRAARLLRGGGGQARRAGWCRLEATSSPRPSSSPTGVIGALTPWNAPLLQIAQKTSHALAAGNTAVVKPSPLACFSTLHYAALATEAGLPPGVLNVVTGGADTGRALVADERVDKVTFTGSTATGRQIASVCGARGASVALELGGKCPLLVFADADLDHAAGETARAAFGTTGQSCVSAARILIEAACYDEFTERLVAAAADLTGGDPFSPDSVMGPLISADARERVYGLVADAQDAGARLAGGTWPQPTPDNGGFFMNPVLLADVPDAARIRSEEIFGPVTCLERFEDEGGGHRVRQLGAVRARGGRLHGERRAGAAAPARAQGR